MCLHRPRHTLGNFGIVVALLEPLAACSRYNLPPAYHYDTLFMNPLRCNMLRMIKPVFAFTNIQGVEWILDVTSTWKKDST